MRWNIRTVCMYVLAEYDRLSTRIIGSGTRGEGTCPPLSEPQNLKSDIRKKLDLPTVNSRYSQQLPIIGSKSDL